MNTQRELRVAIVGCGAVTELAHLPAAARVHDCRITALIDPNAARRDALARTFNVERTAEHASEVADWFDAAIVAVPHALHAPVASELAALGKSLLVEKPMANTSAECLAMINAAEKHGVTLAVGLMRRFLWGHRLVGDVIRNGVFGRVLDFDFAEGAIYFWPVASDFFFRKEAAGGGVLIDAGAHTLDSLLQWLGPVADVEYYDDAEGGVEANCLLKLRLQNGASGQIELSRTRTLRNTAVIRMERGTLEIALAENRVSVSFADAPYVARGLVVHRGLGDTEQDYLAIIAEQMQDWVDAIRARRRPFVDARSAAESVALIETCYARRHPLVLPWDDFAVAHAPSTTR